MNKWIEWVDPSHHDEEKCGAFESERFSKPVATNLGATKEVTSTYLLDGIFCDT